MTPSSANPFEGFIPKFSKFNHLVGVVLLKDMRTRYGGRSHFGYIWGTMIPLLHMTVITGMYYVRTIVAPIGDNPSLFVATGIVPYILCLYPAREMPRTLFENRQLLAIPLIQPIHLMISRAILELLSAIIALAIFLLGLHLMDVDLAPIDIHEAAIATGAAIFLGVGLGFFNTIMAALVGMFYIMFFIFVAIGLFLVAGVYFPVGSMPEHVREYIEYNPIYQLVEWMRAAYYTSYEMEPVNKTMVMGLAMFGVVFGLVGERFIRGKILA
ncbi:ABC transporter permease [Methylocystis sp. S23]|jgi:capsular polysaccharide transport system permease protein